MDKRSAALGRELFLSHYKFIYWGPRQKSLAKQFRCGSDDGLASMEEGDTGRPSGEEGRETGAEEYAVLDVPQWCWQEHYTEKTYFRS